MSSAQAQFASFGPLLPAERATTESPRTVPASEYRDAYCARWSDGCTVCQRTNANDQPSCHPFTTAPPATHTCQHQAVQCQAALKSIDRVCLSYTDGCNRCSNHACTLSACLRPANYQCLRLRTKEFAWGDDSGHWRLTTADGRSCEIILEGNVILTASCLPLGEPVTRLSRFKIEQNRLRFLNRNGEGLLAFDTSNPDDLMGVDQAQGYRLIRLEPAVFSPLLWEGPWELKSDNRVCDLVLSMRDRPAEGQIMGVKVPHAVTFMSTCLNREDERLFDPSMADGARQEVGRILDGNVTRIIREPVALLPVWTSWRTEVSDIVFRDDRGGETVFKVRDDLTWRAEIDIGQKPLVLTLRPKRGR